MAEDTYPGFGKEAPITSIQPGGGWGMSVELAWGRFRRSILRTFFPGYVKEQMARRQGICTLLKPDDVIDERDIKYHTTLTGYSFTGQNPFAWRRHLPFASWGLAEVVVFTLGCLVASIIVGWLAWWGSPPWLVGDIVVLSQPAPSHSH
jgi:phosphatidylserine decarboxylase